MLNWLSRMIRAWPAESVNSPLRGGPFTPPIFQPDSRPLDPHELLQRKSISLDTPELQRYLANKVILVTGAGGSIGSEICRQAIKFCPARLILVEQAENALFEIDRELREKWVGAEIIPYIADVTDETRIEQIFTTERPEVVLHCAAHKHVPMMERHPGEAIKNNIFGTKVVADTAAQCGVDSFVMVSTDKAVNPTSVMGATKRFAELYIQSKNGSEEGNKGPMTRTRGNSAIREKSTGAFPALSHVFGAAAAGSTASATRFVAVRFGNVLGSSGSVVPIFQKQISTGGPVTVTHPEMRRYFMTIPEASQLVLQAGAIAQGGEIFVLDMGEPIKILDLARQMIARAGLREGLDISVEFTGVRPGEKLHEELAGVTEQTRPTSHEKIRVWQLPPATSQQIEAALLMLAGVVNGSSDKAITALAECLPDYTPAGMSRKPADSHLRLIPAEIAA